MKINNFKRINNTLQLWEIPVILGVSLILSGLGIAFIFDLKILATVISGLMLLSGFLGIIYVYVNKKLFDGWSFYLILSVLDFGLAFLLLTVLEIKVTTLSLALLLWILFKGLGKIIYSVDIQKIGIKNWDSDLIIGILSVAYGILSIFLMSLSPAFILLTTAIVLSFTGLFQIYISLGRKTEQKNYLRERRIILTRATLRENRSKHVQVKS